MSTHRLIETLESRTLMSASVLGATVRMDQLILHADFQKFKADIASAVVTSVSDLRGLKSNGISSVPGIKADVAKLRADVRAMHGQLLIDRLTEASNVLTDEAAIARELVQLIHDKGNATAVAADRATLLADRVKLQTDAINGLNSRIATRQADYNTIVADDATITAAIAADTSASPALVAAANKWAADEQAKLTTLSNDLSQLATDRTNLANALTAEEPA